ncbi:hypothetical protein BCR39DRAFT_538216 [Naematelia encephala]|uniref:Uncharacterized protein n=1 Tax=Naematelia encephala TaxID=71784 RepID=A0A1Y2AY13_9TREE|nr:hypothetical protein BCR39DRAFT_538216 [Naematelia encephala]
MIYHIRRDETLVKVCFSFFFSSLLHFSLSPSLSFTGVLTVTPRVFPAPTYTPPPMLSLTGAVCLKPPSLLSSPA